MNDNDNGAGPAQPDPVHDSLSRRQRARRRGSDRSVLGDRGPLVTPLEIRYIVADQRRAQDVYVVDCPFAGCGYSHVHRGKPGVRRAPCRRGRYYVGPVMT